MSAATGCWGCWEIRLSGQRIKAKVRCPASRLKFYPTVAPAWEQVGNRVCSEVETAQCGGESGEVEAGFGETRKRRRGQMQMRAWSAFPGKWLCMLSHPWPEPAGSEVLDTVL